jgi:Periplasmic binding protein
LRCNDDTGGPRERACCLGSNHQDRPDQQLFGVSRPGGRPDEKGIDLYVKEHEKDLPPGVKIEIIRRDDAASPDTGKRLAQELIARDNVQLFQTSVQLDSNIAGSPHSVEFCNTFPPIADVNSGASPEILKHSLQHG